MEAPPEAEKCFCPYCDGPVEGLESACTACDVDLEECPHCGNLTKKGEEKCVKCGADLEP